MTTHQIITIALINELIEFGEVFFGKEWTDMHFSWTSGEKRRDVD